MGYKVAVVGATGNVGREMLDILAEREFPADEVVALASRRVQGTECSFGDKTLKVKALDHYDFSDVDICLMSAGGAVSKEWSPKIAAAGAVVIDNSSAWRMDPDVPLIVPEVNADAVNDFTKKNIIANPNCSTAQLVVALKPLHDAANDQARGGGDLSIGVGRRQGRVVDHHRAGSRDLRRPLLRNAAARRHEANVDVGEVVMVERLHLQRLVAERSVDACALARGERDDIVSGKFPLGQNGKHLTPDIAGGTDHGDLVTHCSSSRTNSPGG